MNLESLSLTPPGKSSSLVVEDTHLFCGAVSIVKAREYQQPPLIASSHSKITLNALRLKDTLSISTLVDSLSESSVVLQNGSYDSLHIPLGENTFIGSGAIERAEMKNVLFSNITVDGDENSGADILNSHTSTEECSMNGVSLKNSEETFYGVLCSGLTAKTRDIFTCSNYSFLHCTRKYDPSFTRKTEHNSNCAGPSYEGCPFSGSNPPTLSTATTFTQCQFADMTASNGAGSAIYGKGTSYNVKITSCVFKNCTASKQGGAIYLQDKNTVTVTSTYFQKCEAGNGDPQGGGGIAMAGAGSSLTVSSSSFLVCKANVGNYGGGGVHVKNLLKATFSLSRFLSCSSTHAGGGVFINSNTQVSYTETLFSGNSATSFGAAIREYEGVK